MKINQIILNNFGSYEGENIFETRVKSNKNIVLIGGKNGAGKTTLFTAIRLCLYGYMSLGHKSINSFYNRSVIKLINNAAKLKKPAQASISLNIELNNSHGVDEYVLTRSWILTDSLTEHFTVMKNGLRLSADDISNFEKYILSLIPPELFNLYFFDGEKIADFFMEEGGNSRIKNAFLTLCGYDIFDIMRRNFKRISSSSEDSSPALTAYIEAKDVLEQETKEQTKIENEIISCNNAIDLCIAEITSLEKQYQQNGGISQEEWDSKIFDLKQEEKKRENYNSILKKWSNEIIPFVMIRDQLIQLREQIDLENKNLKYKNFCEILDSSAIKDLINNRRLSKEMKELAFKCFGTPEAPILDLSFEQSAMLISSINELLDFDVEKIKKCKSAIKKSLAKSAKLRQELEESNISTIREYMKRRAELFEEKSGLYDQLISAEQSLNSQKEKVEFARNSFVKTKASLEAELKKASINDISAKSIIMLDKLEKSLYQKQIQKVEDFFRKEIRTLMRKSNFIDDIAIDEHFNIHLYRNEEFSPKRVKEIFDTNTEEQIRTLLGEKAIYIIKQANKQFNDKTLVLPVEIDKSGLSNGEKQIFIMALYHSLVQLCNYEIPFIIDTPFARIDTEHRENISKYFFSKLNGQVFILSTNEEINSSHVKILNDSILATFMLENTDNKRTTIVHNEYFEV